MGVHGRCIAGAKIPLGHDGNLANLPIQDQAATQRHLEANQKNGCRNATKAASVSVHTVKIAKTIPPVLLGRDVSD
jgi:hypothetical protein